MVPDAKHGFEFLTDDAVQIDKRAAAWFFYTFYPREMVPPRVGTVYLAPIADHQGNPIEAGKNYRLHVPKDVPARQFWSLTLYDKEHLFASNPLNRFSLGTKSKSMKLGDDGSLTLYVQANSPGPDKEANWLPAPKEDFSLYIRAYWPQAELTEGKWTPPHVEKLK